MTYPWEVVERVLEFAIVQRCREPAGALLPYEGSPEEFCREVMRTLTKWERTKMYIAESLEILSKKRKQDLATLYEIIFEPQVAPLTKRDILAAFKLMLTPPTPRTLESWQLAVLQTNLISKQEKREQAEADENRISARLANDKAYGHNFFVLRP